MPQMTASAARRSMARRAGSSDEEVCAIAPGTAIINVSAARTIPFMINLRIPFCDGEAVDRKRHGAFRYEGRSLRQQGGGKERPDLAAIRYASFLDFSSCSRSTINCANV